MPREAPAELATIGAVSALVLVAFTLRLIPILFVPSLNCADEVFQTTEQAHRLVYGTGLVPWEFQLGIRSWLLPGVIAELMEFAGNFGDGPDYYLPLIASAWGLLAVVPVVCCFLWCKRWFGLSAAIVGGLCVGVAPELVYMGDRTLTEVLAAHLLVLALYLLDPGFRVVSFTRLFWAGSILGLAFVLRVQLAPAIALIALWTTTRNRWTDFLSVAAGGSVVLALAALLDAVTLGSPLASVWRYVLYNSYYDVSATFGTSPWYLYAFVELVVWRYGLAAVLILAMLGTRRTWLSLATALVIVAAHSLIGHKEYRFIYPAIVLLAVQAGIGLAGLVECVREKLGFGRWRMLARRTVPVLAAGLWCALSLTTWTGPVLAAFRNRAHDYLLAASAVAHDPSLCGIGMYGADAWELVRRLQPSASAGADVLAEGWPRTGEDGSRFQRSAVFDGDWLSATDHPRGLREGKMLRRGLPGSAARAMRHRRADADAVSRVLGRIGPKSVSTQRMPSEVGVRPDHLKRRKLRDIVRSAALVGVRSRARIGRHPTCSSSDSWSSSLSLRAFAGSPPTSSSCNSSRIPCSWLRSWACPAAAWPPAGGATGSTIFP